MKKLLMSIVLVLVMFSSVSAKEAEPDPLPKWMTNKCFMIISTIVQHEVGFVPSIEAREFVASQVIMDAERMGCNNLTQWRWAIKSWPNPSLETRSIVASMPQYPRCKFVGNVSDVYVWRSYGYRARVDYVFRSGRYTVVGADCNLARSSPRIDHAAIFNMPADE